MGIEAAILSGIGVGLLVAAPIGPMGLLCIQRTIAFGKSAGMATGMAAVTAHAAYSAIVVFGLAPTLHGLVPADTAAMMVLSALILIWLAVRTYGRVVDLDGSAAIPRTIRATYLGALAAAILNPTTPLLFSAALAGAAGADLPHAPLALMTGICIGSTLWWIALSTAVGSARSRLDREVLTLTNKASGIALAGFGAYLLLQAAAR